MGSTVSTSDLQALWAGLAKDDTGALKLLMENTYQVMFGYGMRFSKDRDFVEDCIQDVFVAIWQHRKKLVVPDSPKGYLLTSLRRKMINNGVKGTWISIDSLYDFDPAQEISPEAALFAGEETVYLAERMKTLLSKLSDRQREAVYLRFYQNLERPEIASVMNISEQSVSNLLQKALHTLRKSWPATHYSPLLNATLLSWLLKTTLLVS